jgi:branched-chain amino acid transport system substrate-binding protein
MKQISTVIQILLSIFLCSNLVQAQEVIKIGFAYVFSDRLAHYGYGAKQGAEMAMDEINQAGGINGKKLVGIYADTKLNPTVGVSAVTKLILEDKVDIVMGIVSSGVADAVAPVADKFETPLIITLAMTPDVTGSKCNPYTFRISTNGPQNILGAAQIASELPAKKWTTVGPDYLYGYQSWEYFQKYLRDKRQDVSFAPEKEAAYAPVTTIDFNPYIDKAMATNADGLLITLYGGNLIDFIRQGTAKKLFDGQRAILMNLAYSADVMFGLGLEMPKGLWLGGLYWFQANANPVNEEFVQNYSKRYKIFPDYNAHGGYCGVKAYAAAIQKAGGTNKKQIAKALEGITVDLPIGMINIRAADHQAVTDGCWGQTGEFDSKNRTRLLQPLRLFKGEDITPAVERTGCTMRKLE